MQGKAPTVGARLQRIPFQLNHKTDSLITKTYTKLNKGTCL